MNGRHAAMIRQGLMIARHDHLNRYIDYHPRLTRRAYKREKENIAARNLTEWLRRRFA